MLLPLQAPWQVPDGAHAILSSKLDPPRLQVAIEKDVGRPDSANDGTEARGYPVDIP